MDKKEIKKLFKRIKISLLIMFLIFIESILSLILFQWLVVGLNLFNPLFAKIQLKIVMLQMDRIILKPNNTNELEYYCIQT